MSFEDGVKAFDEFQGRKTLTSKEDNIELAKIEVRHWALNQIRKIALNDFGVLSLSGNFNDPVMWGHYADSSRGFVLGLLPMFFVEHSRSLNVLIPRKVTYQVSPPVLDLDPYINGDEFHFSDALSQNYEAIFYTKSVRWGYEKEFRVVAPLPSESPTLLDNGYPVHLIDLLEPGILVVISGANASKRLDDCLNSLAKNINAHFFKAVKANNEYSYGLWDEETYLRKIKAFDDKVHFGYKHSEDQKG
ncbi:MAG: DUF2971 domain-containing protein [Betaproteobacteria bacterium]|nr:DUF2971 domain-containing protein [Betaproteobacteria bacterium]